jgi:hypothetical protein
VVNFPAPYRQAPNVELQLGGFNKTVITECTPTCFKWKNTENDDIFNDTAATWVRRGLTSVGPPGRRRRR